MGSIPFLGSISGSRAATILRLNGFQTLFSLWQIMMEEIYPGFNASKGYIMPPQVDNPAVRWGSAFESAIIKLAEKKADDKIIDREGLFQKFMSSDDDIKMRYSCHIDGRYKKNKFILHEGKTTSLYNFYDWGKPGTDRVTDYIACQVQHQLMVTGLEQCIVSVLVFPKRPDEWEKEGWVPRYYNIGFFLLEKIIDDKIIDSTTPLDWATINAQQDFFHQYPIRANPEAHKLMIEKYTEFWRKHIIEKIEPQPESYDDIKRCFPQPVGTVIADENIEMLADEYSSIGKEIGDGGNLAKRQADIKTTILNYVRKMEPVIDNDSMEKLIIRNSKGEKIGSFGKNKNGTLIYRGKD